MSRAFDVTPEDFTSAVKVSRFACAASLINATIFVTATWSVLGLAVVTAWWCVSAGVFILFFAKAEAASRRYRGRARTGVSDRAIRHLTIGSILLGSPWAFLPMAFLGRSPPLAELVILTVCAGMCAGGAFMLHRVAVAAMGYCLPILFGVVSASILRDPTYWPIALYSAPYAATLLLLVARTGRTARERDLMLKRASEINGALRVAHNQISVLAYQDDVTHLPNRKALSNALETAVRDGASRGERFAVAMLDLDRFKNVNDTLGHAAGDLLLAEIAKRLRGVIGARDTAARLGGDEFALILRDVESPGDLERRARRVLSAVAEPAQIRGVTIHPNTSIGLAAFPDDAQAAEDLIKCGDIALHCAKELGRGAIAIYDRRMASAVEDADALERDLRLALRNDGLEMRYQPKIDIATGRITGAEALIRWPHPVRGMIAPPVFLAVAEERGLLLDISRFVFARVAEDIARFRPLYPTPIRIALNIHPVDLKNPAFLYDQIELLWSRGVSNAEIIFEITEGCVVGRGADAASLTLDRLQELGVKLSLDDFGTGHASLSHLKRLPVSELKVDREFVSGICDDVMDRAIVSAAVEIARCAKLTCVAEGVENEAQLAALRDLGCDLAQGYLFAPALPRAEFAELLTARRRAVA